MPLARPHVGLHVCHLCVWLLLGTCILAERNESKRNCHTHPRAKLELDHLQADQQSTPAQNSAPRPLMDTWLNKNRFRKVDQDGLSSDKHRLLDARRAPDTSIVQVGAQEGGCTRSVDKIKISLFDIPTDAGGRRKECLLHQSFSNSQNVELILPLRKDVEDTLTCIKDQDSWKCENDCSFGIALGRGPGKPDFDGPPDRHDQWWCHISSVKYNMESCNDEESVVAKTAGYQVLAAAVRTCESLGYLHQNLVDGARRSCPKTGDPKTSLSLRIMGLMTNGMSWYMEQQGFAPIVNYFKDGERESWNEARSLDKYCEGAADAQQATLANVFTANCLTNPPAGWEYRSTAHRANFTECGDSDTLGSCYNKLGGPLLKSANCEKFKMLEELLYSELSAEYTPDIEAHVAEMPEPSPCKYKTRALWWAANMHMWTRRTHGIHRPDGQLVTPAYPRRYCGNDNRQEAGEACTNTDGEKCLKGLKCPQGKSACCKTTDGPARAASHCCSGYDLEFDATEKMCKYKKVSFNQECKEDYQCPKKDDGSGLNAGVLLCKKRPGEAKKKCCGGPLAKGTIKGKSVTTACCLENPPDKIENQCKEIR